jgi:hypothetical protein
LFNPLTGDERSLHPASVRFMLASRAALAGIPTFGFHDFRRTFATELLRTHDIALVGKLLNHQKLASTLIYDLADEQQQRQAVASIDLPAPPLDDTSAAPAPTPRPDHGAVAGLPPRCTRLARRRPRCSSSAGSRSAGSPTATGTTRRAGGS